MGVEGAVAVGKVVGTSLFKGGWLDQLLHYQLFSIREDAILILIVLLEGITVYPLYQLGDALLYCLFGYAILFTDGLIAPPLEFKLNGSLCVKLSGKCLHIPLTHTTYCGLN